MGTTNQINANTAGIVTYDGAGNFSADTTTNHNVLVGAPSNGITNVAPGAAGTALASNGVSADPSFQAIPGIGVTVTNHATLVGGASNSITSLALGTSGQVLTSNGAGIDPSYQSLPAATGVQTLTDGSANVVSPSGGTITFVNGQNVANLSGSANHITFDVTGTTNHAVQIGNSSGNLTSIATGTSGQALVSGGASADPAFGTLPVAGGGTGATTLTGVLTGNGTSPITASTITQYGSLVAGASNAVASVGPGAAGTVLASNGLSANPSYQVVPGIGSTVTQHDVLVGGASNNIVSVTPTSNVGWVLTSNGTSADPSFQALSASISTLTDDTGSSVSPSAGNVQFVGHINEQVGKFSTVVAGSHLLNINPMSAARWIVDGLGFNGTHTTISSAVSSASSGDTILILPGIYTENVTLKSGVNLFALGSNSASANGVTLVGKLTINGSSPSVISGISFQTNSDFAISSTSGSATFYFNECYILASNNTAINNSSSSGASFKFQNCVIDTGTTGISQFTLTGTGGIAFTVCALANNGNSTTANTHSQGTLFLYDCNAVSLQISSSGSNTLVLIIRNCTLGNGNNTMVTFSSSNSSNYCILDSSYFNTGNAVAATVNSAAPMYASNNFFITSNTNVFTGNGILYSGANACANGSGNTVTTKHAMTLI